MTDALIYLSFCAIGYIAAQIFKRTSWKSSWLGSAQTIAVLVLIFAMGLRVGSNREVISNLGSYGLWSFVFTIITLATSVAAVFVFRRCIRWEQGEATGTHSDIPGNAQKNTQPVLDKGTIRMILFVAGGIACGYAINRSGAFDVEAVAEYAGTTIMVGLCTLLFLVGLDLGIEGKILENIKAVGIISVIIPVVIAFGTYMGALICSFILPLSIMDCFAIGSGFAWYSLSSAIIMDAGLITTGAMAFMHNVMRELFAIILIPIIAKKIGFLESIALPGATAMDVCLPVVAQSTNGKTAICSFVSGFILSMSVPFVVPLFV